MAQLQVQGVAQLDLGGVNTHDLPGISRFKLGTGGQVMTLGGDFLLGARPSQKTIHQAKSLNTRVRRFGMRLTT
jgi:lipid II:glycine glycyltransferase (peptidoglycan interpeptide bridge formation enzyme)